MSILNANYGLILLSPDIHCQNAAKQCDVLQWLNSSIAVLSQGYSVDTVNKHYHCLLHNIVYSTMQHKTPFSPHPLAYIRIDSPTAGAVPCSGELACPPCSLAHISIPSQGVKIDHVRSNRPLPSVHAALAFCLLPTECNRHAPAAQCTSHHQCRKSGSSLPGEKEMARVS